MRWAKWRPMAEIVCEVRELNLPRDSKSNGMKDMPAEAQGAWCRSLFRDSPTCSAYPGVAAAPWMVRRWSEQMTEMSKAAGRPRFQLGRKMSAGQDWQLGIRWGDFLRGARAAVWAAVKLHPEWSYDDRSYPHCRHIPHDGLQNSQRENGRLGT